MLRKSIYLCIGLVVLLAAYYVFASLSESRRYSKYSVDYVLLTPTLIKNLPISDTFDEAYFYSAADGNKPAISSVTFKSNMGQENVREVLVNHLNSLGYEMKEAGLYARGDEEVTVEYIANDDGSLGIRVSLLLYLE